MTMANLMHAMSRSAQMTLYWGQRVIEMVKARKIVLTEADAQALERIVAAAHEEAKAAKSPEATALLSAFAAKMQKLGIFSGEIEGGSQ